MSEVIGSTAAYYNTCERSELEPIAKKHGVKGISRKNMKTIREELDIIARIKGGTQPCVPINQGEYSKAYAPISTVTEQEKRIIENASQLNKNVVITDAKPTKVALVGFAENWQEAPFANGDDFEIWGLNELYKYFEKLDGANADRWFEIHSRESPSKKTEEHINWLKQCPIPIYMWQHYDDMPCSVGYPFEEVLKFVESKHLTLDTISKGVIETKGNRYVTNTISWMFLLAWMEGFKEIHIYGVNLACKEEYLYQRPNLEYYIGAAQVDGIKVVMPETCDLLKASQLYGTETDNKFRLKMKSRIEELKKRTEDTNKEVQKVLNEEARLAKVKDDLVKQIVALEGCVKEDQFWLRNWVV